MTKFDDDMLDNILLRREYDAYVARCNDMAATMGRYLTFPMPFDDWWRSMADNVKDNREGK